MEIAAFQISSQGGATSMSDDLDPDEPPAIGAQQDHGGGVWSALGDLVTWAWLPPDVLETWGERVLAVVALLLVMWLLFDIAWQEL
jgi:hypothetical protein